MATSIGDLVRERRTQRGMTQSDLALQTGLRQAYISQVEKGEIAIPRDNNLDALGKALGLSRHDFYRAAGMLEGSERQGTEQPSVFDDLIAILEADPELGPQLAEIKASQTPATYRRAIAALAEAWKSNGKMMLWTWQAAQQARGREEESTNTSPEVLPK